jgi:glucokinase-like ROK family protein
MRSTESAPKGKAKVAASSRARTHKATASSAQPLVARRAALSHPKSIERATFRQVLQILWRERQISRAEIARRTDLSRSTVSDLVTDLLETGIVREVGAGPSLGGRRPVVLEFQDDAFGILGVDMGASHVSVALVNLRGRVIAWEEKRYDVRTDPDGTRALILQLADACLASQRGGAARLVGIGVAVPSPIDPRAPELLSTVVLPAWRGRGPSEDLRQRYGVPVITDNDANLGALAELWWGSSRNATDSAYIKVATGIGSGHIIRGQIYRGSSGTAGEIGHVAVDPRGPLCQCGLRGCLTMYVGTEALVRRAKQRIAEGEASSLRAAGLTGSAIEDAAIAGDPVALAVVREAAEHLGVAIAGLLNLMNPSVVSIGGSLARLGDLLLYPLREAVRARTLISSLVAAEIVAAELGSRDVAIGAATLVLSEALEDPRRFPFTITKH